MTNSDIISRIDVPCVLCGSGEADVCYRIGEFRVQRCVQCGLVAINPRFQESQTSEVYQSYYSEGAGGCDSDGEKCYGGYIQDIERQRSRPIHLNRVHLRRLRTLEDLAPGRRLLDNGSGAGFFLLDARERGWTVSGLEVSDSAAAHARSRGLAVQTGTLSEMQLESESVDAATLWDVVEHLHDPLRDLGRLRRVLRPGGVLALSTPNYESILRIVRGAKWHGFKLDEHLSLFSPQTMGFLLEEAGFEPVRMLTERTHLIRARRLLLKIRGRVPGLLYELLRLSEALANETVGKAMFLPWEKMLRGDMMEVYAVRRQ
jgi:2-polyprenyl-3-methyl-5-hydroxy-6-metoxy-1,4-benzoquinol methylase